MAFQIACAFRGSIVVSIAACHAEDPGSIPGRGVCVATPSKPLRVTSPAAKLLFRGKCEANSSAQARIRAAGDGLECQAWTGRTAARDLGLSFARMRHAHRLCEARKRALDRAAHDSSGACAGTSCRSSARASDMRRGVLGVVLGYVLRRTDMRIACPSCAVVQGCTAGWSTNCFRPFLCVIHDEIC